MWLVHAHLLALVWLLFICFCFAFFSFKTIFITKICAKVIIARPFIKSTYNNYFDRQHTMTPARLPIEVLCAGHTENSTAPMWQCLVAPLLMVSCLWLISSGQWSHLHQCPVNPKFPGDGGLVEC